MTWWRYIVSAVVGLLVGLFAMWCFQRCSVQPVEPIVHHDTIRVHDTLRLREHTKTIEVIRHDTIWLDKVDSAKNAHTTTDAEYALVPITQSEYRDTFATDSTRAEVAVLFSGYNARIDSIGINYQATIQPRVERKKRGFGWCVMPSVQVGWGVAFGNQVITAPYVGVGFAIGWGYHW